MKRALVSLDNVDRVDQIDELLDQQHAFAAGSKIIVTTRCEDALITKGIENHTIYKPKGLDNDQSFKLLSHHAFLSEQPMERFQVCGLSEQDVQVTGGGALRYLVLCFMTKELKKNGKKCWSGWCRLKVKIFQGFSTSASKNDSE
ncbi:disease resistance protein Roq1-like [Nymphaea colorata]|nr:disease resistance protein Roq1-like [Nymphaea colorata]